MTNEPKRHEEVMAMEEQIRRLTSENIELKTLREKPKKVKLPKIKREPGRVMEWLNFVFDKEYLAMASRGAWVLIVFCSLLALAGIYTSISRSIDDSHSPIFCSYTIPKSGVDPWDTTAILLKHVRYNRLAHRATITSLLRKNTDATNSEVEFEDNAKAHDFMNKWHLAQCPDKIIGAAQE